MNLMADYEYRIEVSSDRFKGIIMSCLMLPYHPVTLQYRIEAIGICDEDIFLNDPLFGPIGKIEIRYQATSQTLLSFINPGYPELSDVANYLPQLEQIQLDYQTRVRLWMSQDQPEKVIAQMQPILHQVRMQRHREIREWLFSRLRIFGYRNLISQVSPGMDPETFHFPIQATCAQVAVLARHISRDWEEKPGPMPACLIQDPETFYAVGNVLPDCGPLNVILTKKNGSLKCMIQSTSCGQSMMHVILADREDNWRLWDILRDEMELAGYFHIEKPDFLVQPETESSKETRNPTVKNELPEKEDHQQILILWKAGETAKAIARQSGRTEKTILNLLTLWRKEYGEAVVPRRR